MSDKEKEVVSTRSKKGKIIGWSLAGVQTVASLVFLYSLLQLDMIPTKYFVGITVVLAALCILNFVLQIKKIPGIIMSVVGVLISAVLIVGCVYIFKANDVKNKIAGADTQVDEMAVYVMAEDNAKTIGDAAEYNFGILKDKGRDATDKMVDEVNEMINGEIATTEYDDILQDVDALYAGEVNAIIINKANVDLIVEQEGYEDFETKTKELVASEVKTKVEDTEKENIDMSQFFTLNDDVFTLYISGIDTYGVVSKTSRSDVNIIAVVNTKSKQVLLVSTPRDYYVPLSVSNGVKDKLTHAGIYGINCSMDTLASIYNVPLQYYFRLNFTGFTSIIDALGGVTVYSNYAFTTLHGNYSIKEGYNTLNGDQALGFARERYSLAGGDRQRGKDQMEVIRAMIDKICSSSLLYNYMDIMNSLSDCFQTSMPTDMINGLVKMQINDMSSWNVVSYSVDGTGMRASTYSMPRSNLYVMDPDQSTIDKAKELIQQVIDGQVISN